MSHLHLEAKMLMKHIRKRVLLILSYVFFGFSWHDSIADTVALYRLFNKTDHFYTTNCPERISAQTEHSYKMEGIAGYVENKPASGSTPLFRLWNGTDHFYTASSSERDSAMKGGYKDEGIVGFVSSDAGDGKTALYRSVSPQTGDHFYTTDATDGRTPPNFTAITKRARSAMSGRAVPSVPDLMLMRLPCLQNASVMLDILTLK